MNIEITEADFASVYSAHEVDVRFRGVSGETLGESSTERPDSEEKRTRAVLDALPRVLTRRLEEVMPKDWCLKEIVLRINVAGRPFGVGLEADATVKFGPK
jgi:hypothetical protein